MKLFKNGLVLFLLICLGGTVFYYALRDNTQQRLDKRVAQSLELNKEAFALLAAEDYGGAQERLLHALSLNRLNAWTYGYLGYAELNLGNRQQAYEYFVSTLNLETTSADLIKSLADMLLQGGHYAEAERYLQYGLKDFPDDEALQAILEQTPKTATGK
ncbi:MAG: tetratricopeptide repeat protein [Syntrophomonadaceae bacterium]|nr:tetratricopeptide repeat protein [Syntrophomonadaceae bacterium]